MPQNESLPEQMPSPVTEAAPRAPLPGEPGFKAPLTQKQLKRVNQTIKGMFISVGLTVAVALPVVLLNPASNKDVYTNQHVDQAAVAMAAQQNITTQGFTALNPTWPDGWYVNRAAWNAGAADGVGYWTLGVIKNDADYAEVMQTDAANPSWVSLVTDGALPTGEKKQIDGVEWEVRSFPSEKKPKSLLVAKIGSYTYILRTDKGREDFLAELASLVKKAAPTG